MGDGERPWKLASTEADHALIRLLLCNDYDPNLELWSALDAAIRTERFDPFGSCLVPAARVI